MMRCQNPYCSKLISSSRYHVRFQSRTFCGETCRKEWERENDRITYSASSFKHEISYPPCGDECDCDMCAQPELPLPEPSTG